MVFKVTHFLESFLQPTFCTESISTNSNLPVLTWFTEQLKDIVSTSASRKRTKGGAITKRPTISASIIGSLFPARQKTHRKLVRRQPGGICRWPPDNNRNMSVSTAFGSDGTVWSCRWQCFMVVHKGRPVAIFPFFAARTARSQHYSMKLLEVCGRFYETSRIFTVHFKADGY